jgi:hypothetical protein
MCENDNRNLERGNVRSESLMQEKQFRRRHQRRFRLEHEDAIQI